MLSSNWKGHGIPWPLQWKVWKASDVKRKKLSRTSGCKGNCVLRALPYHNRITNTPDEPMHLIKNIAEHLVHLLCVVEDSKHVHEEERIRNHFESSWVTACEQFYHLLFSLSWDQIILPNDRERSICVPSMFDLWPRDVFTSSKWKEIICSGILKFFTRDLLGPWQQLTLYLLCDVVTHLCSHDVDTKSIEKLEADTHHAPALLERDFPVSFNAIVFHLLHHLPFYIQKFGQLQVIGCTLLNNALIRG